MPDFSPTPLPGEPAQVPSLVEGPRVSPIPLRPKKSFWRKPWTWTVLFLALIAIGGGFVYNNYRLSKSAGNVYDTAVVKRLDLKQTVTATGAVKSATEFSLNFEASGRVATTTVGKGEAVKAGQILAALEGTDYSLAAAKAAAALAEAQANLNKAIAGAAPEEIQVKQAALSQTEAGVSQAQTSLDNAKKESVFNVDTSGLSVKKATADRDAAAKSLEDAKIAKTEAIDKSRNTARADVEASAVTMATALTDMDNILGVDNTNANDSFESVLASLDPAQIDVAKQAYQAARDAKNSLEARLLTVPENPSRDYLTAIANEIKTDLGKFTAALLATRKVLDLTLGGGGMTLADLNTKKSTVDTDRTAVNVKIAALNSDLNNMASAESDYDSTLHASQASLTGAEIALDQAGHNLEIAKLQADTTVKTEEANRAVAAAKRDAARADLDLLNAKLRAVDRAPLEAAVAQASAAARSAAADLGKTEIKAPVDGIVTDVRVNVGELATASTAAVTMLSTHYEVEADISETDIAKVRVGQTVDITLDALGSDVHFAGIVLSINPAETVVQDIVYYKVRVVIGNEAGVLKPGMTANLAIATAANPGVLVVPLRAVREDKAGRYVEVLIKNQPVRRPVELGLRGDEGLVEITSGLAEGDVVVTGNKSQ